MGRWKAIGGLGVGVATCRTTTLPYLSKLHLSQCPLRSYSSGLMSQMQQECVLGGRAFCPNALSLSFSAPSPSGGHTEPKSPYLIPNTISLAKNVQIGLIM